MKREVIPVRLPCPCHHAYKYQALYCSLLLVAKSTSQCRYCRLQVSNTMLMRVQLQPTSSVAAPFPLGARCSTDPATATPSTPHRCGQQTAGMSQHSMGPTW
jgi:hypothetical protein